MASYTITLASGETFACADDAYILDAATCHHVVLGTASRKGMTSG